MSRLRGIAILAGTAGMVLIPISNAGAVPVVQGNLRCTVGASTVHLDPPAIDFDRDETPPPRPWNASRVTMTAPVTACRGTNPADPAPGGITYGALELKGKLKRHDCGNFDGMRAKIKLALYNASGVLVAKPKVTTTNDFSIGPIVPPLLNGDWTFRFAGTMRSGAKGFGGEPVVMSDSIDGLFIGHVCLGDALSSFTLGPSVLSIGNPT